jgi:hypothetical protein
VVGKVISGAFDAYAALFPVLIAVTAAVVVPYEAVLLALQLSAPDTDDARTGLLVVDGVASVLLVLPLVTVVAMRCGQARERGEAPRPWRALVEGLELLTVIAGTQLLVLLAIAFLPGLLILGGAAAGLPGLVLAGSVTLLASAIINGVRLALAVPVVLLENGPRFGSALRRSAELVRGAWRSTLLTLLALGGCALLIQLVATAAAAVAIASVAGEGGRTEDVAARLAAALSGILTLPFVALGSLALYRARSQAASGVAAP